MTGFAVPILFMPGAEVACPHGHGVTARLQTHQWQRIMLDQTIVAMVWCGPELRLYVHEGDRDVVEAWLRQRPGRAVLLGMDTESARVWFGGGLVETEITSVLQAPGEAIPGAPPARFSEAGQ